MAQDRKSTPDPESQPGRSDTLLNYAGTGLKNGRNPFRIALFLSSVFLAGTPALLMPDLHNTMPFLFPWSIAGLIASIVTLVTWQSLRQWPEVRREQGRSTLVVLVIAWLLGGVIIAMWWPGIDPHTLARRVNRCANNLQQIGVAMLIYSNGNSRSYPSSIDALVATGEIAPTQLICPAALHDAIAEGLSAPTWPSYWYLGKGLNNMCDPKTVLAVELPGHHEDNSISVLRADFSVERVLEPEASVMLSDLASGINPPRSITERQQIGVK